jgi:predicted nucleotidyltransferase
VPQDTARVDRSSSAPPEIIARIIEVLHPEQVWLFGSRARGEARVNSDWDFMAILPDSAPEQDLDPHPYGSGFEIFGSGGSRSSR